MIVLIIFSMIAQGPEPIKQIIRYEQQLKAISQRIQIMILDDNPNDLQSLRQLINEEGQLIKYLEIESSKLNPQSKQIYVKNIERYKRKAKEQRDYISTNHGSSALPKSQQAVFMDYQNQNAALAQNKLAMYENQRVQDSMGRELYYQGEKLYGGIEQNRNIRKEAGEAEGSIKLIQMAILKRKLMFVSLFVLFILILIFAIVRKVKKSS